MFLVASRILPLVKKLLLLLFSLMLSFNAFGEWVYIDKEKNSDTEVYVLNDSIEIEDGYVCIFPKAGKVSLRLEGKGDSTLVSEWVN